MSGGRSALFSVEGELFRLDRGYNSLIRLDSKEYIEARSKQFISMNSRRMVRFIIPFMTFNVVVTRVGIIAIYGAFDPFMVLKRASLPFVKFPINLNNLPLFFLSVLMSLIKGRAI